MQPLIISLYIMDVEGSKRLLPNDWRPRGIPIAHLHEHRAAVNRVVSKGDTSLFASSSSDGCIKIWDASKMEGRNIANRSRYRISFLLQNNHVFLRIIYICLYKSQI